MFFHTANAVRNVFRETETAATTVTARGEISVTPPLKNSSNVWRQMKMPRKFIATVLPSMVVGQEVPKGGRLGLGDVQSSKHYLKTYNKIVE